MPNQTITTRHDLAIGWASALSLVALLAGCSSAEYEIAPVEGMVHLDGQPTAEVHVSFQPVAADKSAANPGPGSFGVTDKQGRFRLRLVETDQPGAVVGRHRVRLSMKTATRVAQSDAGGPVQSPLPPSARDGSLEFVVPEGGTKEANFILVSR